MDSRILRLVETVSLGLGKRTHRALSELRILGCPRKALHLSFHPPPLLASGTSRLDFI